MTIISNIIERIYPYLNYWTLLPPLALLLFDSIAMSYITKFSLNLLKTSSLIKALVFELIAWLFLVLTIKARGLGRSNAIWDIGSLVIVTLISVLQFKEQLLPKHYLGIILGIYSISLLL